MKNTKIVIAIVTAATLGWQCFAENAAAQPKEIKIPVTKPTAPAKAPAKPASESGMPSRQQVSYAAGMHFGNQMKRSDYDFDMDEVVKAMKDVLAGSPKITEQEAQQTIQRWQSETRKEQLETNKKKAQAFLAENAKKPGIKVTLSGLEYEVLTEGQGKTPGSNDTVKVHYTGTLLNGTEFDSSRKRGQPAEFRVTGVIKGWTEALQMMKVGSRWKLYIPPDLAYGEGGNRGIPPNSLLIFDVELVDVKGAPEEAVQAVSGEIIKVPSADELSKGAKIEVLKEEDVKRMMATNNKVQIQKLTNSATPQPPQPGKK